MAPASLPLLTERGAGGIVPGALPRWRLRDAAAGPGGAGSEQELPGCAGQLNIKLIPSAEDNK